MTRGVAPDGRARTLATAALAASVLLPTLVLYWPALGAGFVGDDFMILHRLRALSDLSEALGFFRSEFFNYYRPLGFISHALDWMIGRDNPRQFHLTNLMLHSVNSLLVLLLARALAQRTVGLSSDAGVSDRSEEPTKAGARWPQAIAGFVAALLFAMHASSHEAVVWVSARFDLLATGFSLLAILTLVTEPRGSRWAAPLLFLGAVLSKESAVALPVGVAAWASFCLRSTTWDTIRRVAPWLLVLAGYALLRQAAGGVPAAGGMARIPKLMLFSGALVFLIWCADERWRRLRDYLRVNERKVAIGILGAVVLVTAGSSLPWWGAALVKEKLSVVGFVLTYLVAPVAEVGGSARYLQPLDMIYWKAALAGMPAAALVVWVLRRRLLEDPRAWFLAALLLSTLLPISALTEGRRYLYLPSAILAVALGVGMVHLRRRWRVEAAAALAVVLLVSGAQIREKLEDWIWAGAMTADASRLVDEALAPACGTGRVVFLTSPVGVRSVYTHFYYETFEAPRGCIPETFQVLARVLRVDTHVDVQWTAPDRIVVTVPNYRGNFVVSDDLRRFDLPLAEQRSRTVQTPLGEVRAEAIGSTQRLTLTLSAAGAPPLFFYYSDGRVRRLPAYTG